ncbi:hypothetical protein ACFLTM_03600 [Candidatus Bipolaricaulota bacterium]
MGPRIRWIGVGALLVCLTLGLAGCTGFWNTAVQLPTLIVGPVMVTGTEGYVLISVIDMPDGGIASIQFGTVGNEAIDHADIDATTIVGAGTNGFVILAKDYTTNPGKATLLAANGATGIIGGEILRFTFDVTGANPTFVVDKTKVTMADDSNTFITVWDISSTEYHTR